MAGDNVKVGVILEFKGFDSKTLKGELKKVKGDLEELANLVPDSKIQFDEQSLQRLSDFAKSLRKLVNEVNSVLTLLSTQLAEVGQVKIIKDGDIQKFKNTIENTFEEALSKVRETFNQVAQQLSESFSSAGNIKQAIQQTAATATKEQKTSEDQGMTKTQLQGAAGRNLSDEDLTKFVQEIKKTGVDLASEYTEIEDETKKFFAALKNFYEGDAKRVAKLSEEFSRFIPFSFSSVQGEGSKDKISELKSMQKEISKHVTELETLRGILKKQNESEGGKDFTKDIENVDSAIKALVKNSDSVQRLKMQLEELLQQAQQSDKITERVQRDKAQFEGLLGRASEEYKKALDSMDPADIQGFLRPFEQLNQSMSASFKDIQQEHSRVETQLSKTKDKLKEIEAQQEKTGEPKTQEIQDLKSQIAFLDQLKDRLQGQKTGLNEMHVQVRQVVQRFRSLERVLQQNDKFIEQVQRRSQTLSRNFDSLSSTMRMVENQVDGQEFLSRGAAARAKDGLSQLESQVKALQKNLGELEVAEELEVQALNTSFRKSTGPFAEEAFGDEAARQQALDNAVEKTRERFKKFRKEVAKDMVQAQEMLGSETADTIRTQLEQSDTLRKVTDDAAKAGKSVENLGNRYKTIDNFSASTTGELKRQATEIKAAQEHWKGLTKQISETEAELQTARSSGGRNIEGLTKKLRGLQKQREQLSNTKLQGGDLVQTGQILADAQSLEKAEQDIIKLARSAGEMTSRFQQAKAVMRETGGTSLNASKDLLKMGSSADEARRKLQEHVATLKRLENNGHSLSNEQRQLIQTAQRVGQTYNGMSTEVKKSETELKAVNHAAQRAGKGFEDYRQGLADSIAKNFQFISAIGVVTAAIFGLKRAFRELIEESRSYGKVLSVMSSNSLSFAETFDRVKKRIRSAARQFGESIQDTSEIVYQLGSAGLSTEESLQGLNDVMKLIVATGGDTQRVTKAVAGVYNVFGEQIKKAHGDLNAFRVITDTITGVYKDHQVEIEEVVQGLQFVSSSANLAGFTFQETAGFLSVLNDNMIKGGRAGRSLQRVFSQFANKADQFAGAFGIDIDQSLTLPEQFIDTLTTVNQQLVSGQINLKQLEDNFRIFGLRGAPAFITLANNVGDVNKAIRELTDESEGVTDELSQVAEETLAKQFEKAKQSLLEFARDGLEPLVEVLKLFVDLIRSFEEGIRLLGPLNKIISMFGAWVVPMVIVLQTLRAIFRAMGALSMRVGEAISQGWGLISTNKAQVQSNLELAASINGVSAAQGKSITTGKTVGKTFSKLPSIFGAATVALLVLIPLIGKVNKSVADLNEDFEGLVREVRKINRNQRDLEKFEKNIDEVSLAIQNTAITAEAAGSSIKKAFKEAGDDIISQNAIIGKSNQEVFDMREEIINQAREQRAKSQGLLKIEQLEKQSELLENVKDSIIAIGAETSEFKQGTKNIPVAMQNLAQEIEYVSGLDPDARAIGSQKEGQQAPLAGEVLKHRKEVLEGYQKDIEKTLSENANTLDQFAREIGKKNQGFTDTWVKAGGKRIEADNKFWENFRKIYGENIQKLVENNLQGLIEENISTPLLKANNEITETAGALRAFFEVAEAPIDQSRFNGVIDGLKTVQEVAVSRQEGIFNLFKLGDRDQGEFGTLSFSRSALEDVLVDRVRGLGNESANAFVKGFKDNIDFGELIGPVSLDTPEDVINVWLDSVTDNAGTATVHVNEFFNLIDKMPEFLPDGEEAKEALITSVGAMAKNVTLAETRTRHIQTWLNSLEDGIAAQNTLNSLESKQLDFRQKLQELQILDLEGRDINAVRENIENAASRIITLSAEQEDAEKEKVEMLQQQIEKEVEVLRLNYEVLKAAKQITIEEEARLNQQERLLVNLKDQRKNRVGSVALASQDFSLQKKTVEQQIEQLKLTEKLNGNYYQSLEGINELVEAQIDLTESKQEFIKLFQEENSQVFETLSIIEQILDRKNEYAGLEEQILAGAQRVSYITGQINRIEGNNLRNQSDKIHLYSQLVEEAEGLFDIEEKILEFQEDGNEILDNRLRILAQIRDSFKQDAEFFEDQLKEFLTTDLEILPFSQAAEFASLLEGFSLEDVITESDQAIDAIVEGLKNGSISANQFSDEVRQIIDPMLELSAQQEDYNNKVKEMARAQQGAAMSRFQAALGRNDAEAATKAIQDYESATEQAFDDDQTALHRGELDKILGMWNKLQDLNAQTEQEFKMKFEIINEEAFDEFFKGLRERIKEIRADLRSMTREDLSEVLAQTTTEGDVHFRTEFDRDQFNIQVAKFDELIETIQNEIDANQERGERVSDQIDITSKLIQSNTEVNSSLKGLNFTLKGAGEAFERLPDDIARILKPTTIAEGSFTSKGFTGQSTHGNSVGRAFGTFQNTQHATLGELLEEFQKEDPQRFKEIVSTHVDDVDDFLNAILDSKINDLKKAKDASGELRHINHTTFDDLFTELGEEEQFQAVQLTFNLEEYLGKFSEDVLDKLLEDGLLSEQMAAAILSASVNRGKGGAKSLVEKALKSTSDISDSVTRQQRMMEIFIADEEQRTAEYFLKTRENLNTMEEALKFTRSRGNRFDHVANAGLSTEVWERLASALEGIEESLSGPNVQRNQSGGHIPGYGGGDRIMSLLEQGEYVIPKQIVSKYGVGFFNALKEGKIDRSSLPKFQSGGPVGDMNFSESEVAGGGDNSVLSFLKKMNNNLVSMIGNSAKILKRGDDSREELLDEIRLHLSSISHVSLEKILNQLDPNRDPNARETMPRKLQSGGRIPGYGGGDRVPAMLEQGEYVIPKQMVSKYGMGFFNALKEGKIDRAKLPSFQSGGVAGAIEAVTSLQEGTVEVLVSLTSGNDPLEVLLSDGQIKDLKDAVNANFAEEVRSLIKTVQRDESRKSPAVDAIKGFLDSKLASRAQSLLERDRDAAEDANKDNKDVREAFSKVMKAFNEELEKMPLAEFFVRNFQDLLRNFGSLWAGFLDGVYAPEFAEANAKAFRELSERIEDIEEQFRGQIEVIESGIQRNESSYLDYLNSIEDAERQRIQERLQAEQEYRDKLVESQDVFRESLKTSFDELFDGTSELFTGFIDAAFNQLEIYLPAVAHTIAKPLVQGIGLFIDNILQGLSSIVSMSLSEEDAGHMVEAFEKFVEDLPEAIPEFVDRFIDNVDRILDAIIEGLPEVLEVFVEELPRAIEAFTAKLSEFLPVFIQTLSDALPEIIQNLVPAVMMLVRVLIRNIPNIVEALIRALPTLVVEIAKEIPPLIGEVIWATANLFVKAVEGLFKGLFDITEWGPLKAIGDFFGGIFHEGGVVGGKRDEVPILAQRGEGVLSREGMRALGGAQALQELNRGRNPFLDVGQLRRFHTGGVVGRDVRSNVPLSKTSSGTRSSQTVNNTAQFNVTVNGKMTDKEIDRMVDRATDRFDKNMAKKVQDRDSDFANKLRR